MDQENEEQQPVPQTFCGALQKEPNCKCLLLSILIYGCLGAVTWCRCANVTKVIINFSKYPIRSTKYVSPCDDGYIYIPVAFMGMLYLVYLVECYHSPIRIDLSHAESQDCVLSKLSQLKLAQPTIWWKAVSYHYVRRKRQITRYRNGDHYTTTQVYYERVNTHAATSVYYYDYCGVKDISKELIPNPKVPITKIALTKGFAFSNIRSATEFEEARSRFFAEQETRDDYMEMREGLDLACNINVTNLVAVLGHPWFTNRYVYWCLSALLLSWPLRVIIEYNTQYADYQITKLFGVNYDTPVGAEPIRTSTSQLSQPGSYMLAPSYSEALLMEPSTRGTAENYETLTDLGIVPSYSEALLYERAEHVAQNEQQQPSAREQRQSLVKNKRKGVEKENARGVDEAANSNHQRSGPSSDSSDTSDKNVVSVEVSNHAPIISASPKRRNVVENNSVVDRDISEPNLPSRLQSAGETSHICITNSRSFENTPSDINNLPSSLAAVSRDENCTSQLDYSKGAIPKRRIGESAKHYRLTSTLHSPPRIPISQTYFCLKSILKQKRRRYTVVTAVQELENFRNLQSCLLHDDKIKNAHSLVRENSCKKAQEKKLQFHDPLAEKGSPSMEQQQQQQFENTRTLIFANPIQQTCPNDPFGGKRVVSTKNQDFQQEISSTPKLMRLKRSLTERDKVRRAKDISKIYKRHTYTTSAEYSTLLIEADNCESNGTSTHGYRNALSFPPYDGFNGNCRATSTESIVIENGERSSTEENFTISENLSENNNSSKNVKSSNGLTRSLTERRVNPRENCRSNLKRSSTGRADLASYRLIGVKCTNVNMETSL